MDELKSCPFCGSFDLETKAVGHNRLFVWYVVECKKCAARGPIYYIGRLESDDGEAVKLWNIRIDKCAMCGLALSHDYSGEPMPEGEITCAGDLPSWVKETTGGIQHGVEE
jgi:Lar family restriction alleviation protein